MRSRYDIRLFLGVITSLMMVCYSIQPSFGQSTIELMLNPGLNNFELSSDAGATFYGEEDVEDQGTDLEATEYFFRMHLPLYRDDESEWFLSTDWEGWEMHTNARFDESFRKLPEHLYDINLGATYRRKFDNDWIFSQNLCFGSASDKPFDSLEEMYAGGTSLLRIPDGEYNAWLLMLNIQSNSQVPVVPAFAYQIVLHRTLAAVVGLPVLAIQYQPTERIKLRGIAMPPSGIDTSLTYNLNEQIETYIGFDWTRASFSRADRDEWNDKIDIIQKRVKAGVAVNLSERLSLRADGGYAFDRMIGEGDDFDERNDNDIDPKDTWFGSLKVQWTF